MLVSLFGFLVIKSSHGSYKGRHLVEILPTGLPDLSKPSKSTKNPQQTQISETKCLKNPKNYNEY